MNNMIVSASQIYEDSKIRDPKSTGTYTGELDGMKIRAAKAIIYETPAKDDIYREATLLG